MKLNFQGPPPSFRGRRRDGEKNPVYRHLRIVPRRKNGVPILQTARQTPTVADPHRTGRIGRRRQRLHRQKLGFA